MHKLRLVKIMLVVLAALAAFVVTGCDSDNDNLRRQNDDLQEQLDLARQALAEAQGTVTELEMALETAGDQANAQVADLTMQLEAAKEERDDAEAILEALLMGKNLYKVTVTHNLSAELLAPIVVTGARNDHFLFDAANYVTEAAEHQILTGDPARVVASVGEDDTAVGHGSAGPPGVLLPSGEAVPIRFVSDAAALRVLAMVAPTIYTDHYVSAVADTPMGEPVTVPLSRFDIGYDEDTMDIRLIAENAGTVTIERLIAGTMADDGEPVMETATFDVVVTNNLSESAELLAPIVVTRVNDEHYLFDGMYVTEAAKEQILTGNPARVVAAIAAGDTAVGHGSAGPPGVLLPAGEAVPITFATDATALRILAMVAPTVVPDNYVSAVVSVAGLMVSGDSVTAPLTRFDIGDDEGTMDISRIDDDMTVGTVMITRR